MTPGGQFNAEESHPSHKLTKQDVIDIRTRYNNQERKNEVYEDYKNGGSVPTLCTLREKLLEQSEKEAQDLALSLELFTSGSLDAFAHESNVDVNNRMIVYDIMDLGKRKIKKFSLYLWNILLKWLKITEKDNLLSLVL